VGKTSSASAPSLDEIAEAYVKLVLAIGRHDPNYVDAYYGPPAWRQEAEAGPPAPISALLARSRELLRRVRSCAPSDRREFLEKQLVAAEGFLRRLSGERMSLAEEARLLYDIEPPARSRGEFERARQKLDSLLPGSGPLEARMAAFRKRFFVPGDRLAETVKACLELLRERTVAKAPLPDGEGVSLAFVQKKPWGAYNWYQGDLRSRIEVNTDLPIELPRLLRTIAHEAYPGHHTYNILLENRLARGKGWKEFTVYPLYSPQSLLAEGTADAGISVLFSDGEIVEVLERRLAPLAGLENEDFHRYEAISRALQELKEVRGEAAKMLLDEGKPEEEVAAFIERYGLETPERARKALDFARTYRSYVFTYTAGEDLVRAYIGEGEDRADRFFRLLQRPATPSGLLSSPGT
jgi:hypothetical protein